MRYEKKDEKLEHRRYWRKDKRIQRMARLNEEKDAVGMVQNKSREKQLDKKQCLFSFCGVKAVIFCTIFNTQGIQFHAIDKPLDWKN